jgi:hypothetical protein
MEILRYTISLLPYGNSFLKDHFNRIYFRDTNKTRITIDQEYDPTLQQVTKQFDGYKLIYAHNVQAIKEIKDGQTTDLLFSNDLIDTPNEILNKEITSDVNAKTLKVKLINLDLLDRC